MPEYERMKIAEYTDCDELLRKYWASCYQDFRIMYKGCATGTKYTFM